MAVAAKDDEVKEGINLQGTQVVNKGIFGTSPMDSRRDEANFLDFHKERVWR